MKKFSSSYVYERNNFVLFGLDLPDDATSDAYPLFCVAQNIVQRGTPTPADSLVNKPLGLKPPDSGQPLLFSKGQNLEWKQTILGDKSTGDNPALWFYEEKLQATLPPHLKHAARLLLPEAGINQITGEENPLWTDQRVDFFCPLSKTAIEIDGLHHAKLHQKLLDARREDYLQKRGIATVRIKTEDVRKGGKSLRESLGPYIERLENSRKVVAAEDLTRSKSKLQELGTVVAYESFMRIQIALLQLLKTGTLSLDSKKWRFDVKGDLVNSAMKEILLAAAKEIECLLAHLHTLRGEKVKFPKIKFQDPGKPNKPCIHLDISVLKLWSEPEQAKYCETGPRGVGKTRKGASSAKSIVLTIRNDYILHADHYSVATAKGIEYPVNAPEDNPRADKALKFFLTYLFQLDDFRSGQLDILRRALSRDPVIGILPTGTGKSLCYQMACMLQPSINFVICPIISLIRDQKKNLDSSGITHTAYVDSQMNTRDKYAVLDEFGAGRYQLIWSSPERFQTQGFRDKLDEISAGGNFGYAVLDEVHCLSEWGHDFRVSYLKLPHTIKRYCPDAVFLGLTATASKLVLDDLVVELDMSRQCIASSTTLNRPELHYRIIKTDRSDRLRKIESVLSEIGSKHTDSANPLHAFRPNGEDSICGIVFSSTAVGAEKDGRYGCNEVLRILEKNHIPAGLFHGKYDKRLQTQDKFMQNELTVLAATKSFGMGVNKKNIRFTIHNGLPWSVESFYQEAGRAGRDPADNESDCYILYTPDDNKELVNELFSRMTPISRIHELQSKLSGDLSTLFFLWNRNHNTVEEEAKTILHVYDALNASEPEAAHSVDMTIRWPDLREKDGVREVDTQFALYNLGLLGVVEDWVVDWGLRRFDVTIDPRHMETPGYMRKRLERHISRRDAEFTFFNPPEGERYTRYLNAWRERGDELEGLINVLLLWSSDTVAFQRRSAMQNMLQLCESGMNDEGIRAYIDNYFDLGSPEEDSLEKAIAAQGDARAWASILYEGSTPQSRSTDGAKAMLSRKEMAKLSAKCDRYRESYAENIGLEWLSFMTRLASQSSLDSDTFDVARFLIREAKLRKSIDSEELLEETLKAISGLDRQARNAFGELVVELAPNRAAQTYRAIGDDATLAYLVQEASDDIARTWGIRKSRKQNGDRP